MKRIFVLLLISITFVSCADRFERSINRHFNKFILVDDLDEYEITLIKRKVQTQGDYEILKKTNEIYQLSHHPYLEMLKDKQSALLNLTKEIFTGRLYRIDRYSNETFYISENEALASMHELDKLDFKERGRIFYNNYLWTRESKIVPLSKEEIKENMREFTSLSARIKELSSTNNEKIRLLNQQIEKLKSKRDNKIRNVTSEVIISGMTKNGKNDIKYYVHQNNRGEIMSVK